jgi:UDP-3-O-[3-hydroxymyristoyl] N-acetylglucosamine deacetylase
LLESEFYEKTIQHRISVAGVGLFTGQQAHLTFCPAPPRTGIVFRRMDLPGQPEIPAALHAVVPSPRCTKLATEFASIQMVEHVLSAVFALGVNNLLIEVAGPEIPAGDGSSLLFVQALDRAEIVAQPTKRKPLKIQTPVYWSEGDVHLVALPADEFRVSYTLHYPQSKLIGSQFYSFAVDSALYRKEIAPCRTFSLYEEIAPFIAKGLLKGGGLDNALVIKEDQIMNPEGARFFDEMARHKVLDLIGDLALIGSPLLTHIIALRSGHVSHAAFGKQILLARAAKEECLEVFSNPYVLENC